jgi:hypothetical protein
VGLARRAVLGDANHLAANQRAITRCNNRAPRMKIVSLGLPSTKVARSRQNHVVGLDPSFGSRPAWIDIRDDYALGTASHAQL